MSAATALLLSTAWLFGPLEAGTAELRLGAGFAQSDQAQGIDRLTLNESRLEIGAAVAVTHEIWLQVTIPQNWTRQSLDGRVFFDRSGLGDIHLALGHRLGPAGHVGVAFDIAETSTDDSLRDRFAEFSDHFATIGSSSHKASLFGGYARSSAAWRLGKTAPARALREE